MLKMDTVVRDVKTWNERMSTHTRAKENPAGIVVFSTGDAHQELEHAKRPEGLEPSSSTSLVQVALQEGLDPPMLIPGQCSRVP